MATTAPSSDAVAGLYPVALGVARLPILFVNAYFVGEPGRPWVLVDTGLPGAAAWIRRAAEARYGAGARPEAIVLTHGHFDHAGNACALADAWGVPIYAHELELPYLTGRSDYPPKDPTMGGAIAFLARFFPTSAYDFGRRVHPLPDDGSVPGLNGWRWLHTPGHTAGHVSLFRERDLTLLAGDAFATMDLDSWTSQVTHTREVARPPAPFTTDWFAARDSIQRLAALNPAAIGAGHGRALRGADAAPRLRDYAHRIDVPEHGRYVGTPAVTDRTGVVAVPPPVRDPIPLQVAAITAAATVLISLLRR
jgi:glyoxylase-like metal-dependent hydrolase (beta-lactamase superfamily II)